jgi:hypothetical protein
LATINDIYLWTVTAVTAAVALNTCYRLWNDRSRLWQDELNDEDRLLAWRIVFFLIYPLLTLVDLRATAIACQSFGGTLSTVSYGVFWYAATPTSLASSEQLLMVLFAGVLAQLLLVFSLLPALLFRPHPFLAVVIGYTAVAVLAFNLFVDPLLCCLGMGGSRWHLAMHAATVEQKLVILGVYAFLTAAYFIALSSQSVRMWFAHLSHPLVTEQLLATRLQWRINPQNADLNARLAVLCERAGLRRQAQQHFRLLNARYSQSIQTAFVFAYLSYRQRRYRVAREGFLRASDLPGVDPLLKGALLAAAACSAFAEGNLEGALNLSERALEFDDTSLVARMVKVDVFLRRGNKEQAGEEIVTALRRGLDLDLTSKVPVDTDLVFARIGRMKTSEAAKTPVARS